MEANHTPFDYADSDLRMIEILGASGYSYQEVDDIPPRDRLTFTNGFYVYCTALFIDIRGSSSLPTLHTRPVLGKLYRAYISEAVAIMNGNPKCAEIFINGDSVSGIFSTPLKADIDGVFEVAGKLNSVNHLLNYRLERNGYSTITCGVGLAYGRALMVKAGAKGSNINDVVWMGDVVNEASNLCHEGNRGARMPVQVSPIVYENLKPDYKTILTPLYAPPNWGIVQYEGPVVNVAMDQYLALLKAA